MMPVKKIQPCNSSAPSLKGGRKDVVGADENNIHAFTCTFVHTRARTRKEGSREGKREGRKEKEERKEQRDAPKLSHADGHVQARRACCAGLSLPPLGRTFSCCKQERRRRKGGIAQANAKV